MISLYIYLGSGELVITNNMFPHYVMDIGYFFALKDRLQIMYPLQFTKVSSKCDKLVHVKMLHWWIVASIVFFEFPTNVSQNPDVF